MKVLKAPEYSPFGSHKENPQQGAIVLNLHGGNDDDSPTFPPPDILDHYLRSKSKNTQIRYRGAWKRYREMGFKLTAPDLCQWIDTYREKGRSLNTIKSGVSAIRFLAKRMDIRFTEAEQAEISDLIEEAGRMNRGQRRGKAPVVLKEDVLRAAENEKSKGTVMGLRNRAILLTGYNLLARVGEIANWNVGDLTVHADGTGTIRFRFSKTDQMGEGCERPVSAVAVQAIQEYIDAEIHGHGAMFRSLRGTHNGNRLHSEGVYRIVRTSFQRIGIRTSGHTLRRSAATAMARAGCTVSQLKWAGRWKTADAAIGYVEETQENPMQDLL